MSDNRPQQKLEVKKQEDKLDQEDSASQALPDIIGMGLIFVMRDRKNMRELEHSVDMYLATLTAEQKQEKAAEIKAQLISGKGALESIYSRVLQALS